MQNFRALRILGKLYLVVAVVGLLYGLFTLYMVAAAAQDHVPFDWSRFLTAFGWTSVHVVVFLGFSQAVELLLELRQASDRNARLLRKLQPEPEPTPDELYAAEALGPLYKGRKR